MGVLLVDADDVRRQQLGTVLSFMGIPWQEVVESDLDVAIETAGPLQGILAGELRERALSELLAAHPRLPFLSLMPASHGCSNFIGVAEAPFTYESLTRHLHFCQAFISLHPRHQTHDKGQTLLRLLPGQALNDAPLGFVAVLDPQLANLPLLRFKLLDAGRLLD